MWRLVIASWLLAVQPGLSQQATPPPAAPRARRNCGKKLLRA